MISNNRCLFSGLSLDFVLREDETHKRMLKEAEEELARTDERINELRQQKDEITAWFQELWRRNDACFQSKSARKQFD